MFKIFLIALFLVVTVLPSCGYSFREDGLYAVVKTSMGTMTFRLYYEKVPVTVGNFVGLAEGTKEFLNPNTGRKEKRPFYDGLIFHRIIKGFMIQGGCPMGNGMGGPGYSFVDEFDPGLRHGVPGILSMANSGPNTNGSQFFITLVPTPHLDGRHAVFGVIVDGMDVLQKIGSVPTRPGDKPVEPVTIKSITFVRVGDKAKAFDANATFGKGMEDAGKPDAAQEEKLKSRLRAMGVPEDGIITKGSGLRYFIKRPGTGKMPSRGDIIQAHYTGYLIDGKKFDSSYDRGTPFETPIGVKRVIAGWDEAFLGMREGEKRVLIIPFDLAYGAGGYPPVIPPRATLIFEVELIRVKPKQ